MPKQSMIVALTLWDENVFEFHWRKRKNFISLQKMNNLQGNKNKLRKIVSWRKLVPCSILYPSNRKYVFAFQPWASGIPGSAADSWRLGVSSISDLESKQSASLL